MVPYTRFLHCLRLKYPNNEDFVAAELRRLGLPAHKAILDVSYDRFLEKLDQKFPGFSSCLFLDLEPGTFKAYAQELDIDRFFNEDRSFVSNMFTIASDPLIRKHVECSLITRISPEVIINDVKDVYRTELALDDVLLFERAFFDIREVYDTTSFMKYADFLPDDEKAIKCKCRASGPEYTRWAIGARVKLETKQMTTDMIADAYFRYRESLATARDPEQVGNAIRLGNLVSKLIDKEVKLNEVSKGDLDKDKSTKEDFGEQLCLFDFGEEKHKTMADINAENQQPPPPEPPAQEA